MTSFRDSFGKRCALGLALSALTLAGTACTEDPQYVDPETPLEIDPAALDPDAPPPTVIFDLPVEIETEAETMRRQELADELGVDIGAIPVVNREDLVLSMEWSIVNLNPDAPARIQVTLNGANEYFNYVPSAFVIDPEEDPEPPPLAESVPVDLEPGATLNGVFREDQMREAAIDLELITRGGLNPFMAMFNNHEDLTELTTTDGLTLPLEAVANMVRYEIGVTTNQPVSLTFAIRARDKEELLHDDLLNAVPEELVVFAPVDFAPPPPVMP